MKNEMNENKDLFYMKKNYFEEITKQEEKDLENFSKDYVNFINNSKTERQACKESEKLAKDKGFSKYEFGQKLSIGDKKYYINRDKNIILFKIGKNALEENGIKIIGSHIDSPRLDLKPQPMYEDNGFCFFKTHYYGGIKKYQWTTIPLALHGVVVLANGEKVEISIGENDDEPIFYISDLLPHLASGQMQQKASEVIKGEQLNLIVGGKSFKSEEIKEKIKLNILKILNQKYSITEQDFMSSEICAVPAFKAREVGFDRAFISAYGHDDKCCAYPALRAILDNDSDDTVMVVLADKEEIGSEGNTGAQSKIIEDIIDEICNNFGKNSRLIRSKSKCISADVTSCYDPNFPEVFEKNNAAKISCGTCVCKYDGSRGKSGSNDASAELVGQIREIFAKENIKWQTGELGKIDAGEGGTIANYIAKLNIDTIDIGLPVVSMHAPYELISKADLYSTYKAFSAFIK